jgi:hypothetical protein
MTALETLPFFIKIPPAMRIFGKTLGDRALIVNEKAQVVK